MPDTDWEKKYRRLIEQQGADESERAEIESLLCRTIIRLTLAASGLDPKLDPTLHKIRDAIRKGVDPELKRNLDALSDALMHAEDQEVKPAAASVAPDSELFQRLLGRIKLTGKPAVELKRLIKQVQADPINVSDTQLDKLLALIMPNKDAESHRPGMFKRLFGVKDEVVANSDAVDPNQVLLEMLEKLNWPGYLAGDMAVLMVRLGKGADTEAWIPVLDDLGKLVTSALGEIQTEMRATEDFLSDLTLRLQELDQHMAGAQAERVSSSDNRQMLDAAVKGEVGEIRHTLSIATDLENLKSNIALRLETIQQHVDAHLEAEKMRRKSALVKEQVLRERLHKLEDESNSLHAKMMSAKSKALEDPVTGLPNRIAYEDRLATEVARWKRNNNPLVILVWDVDDFKQINDRFGHLAGDKALGVIGRLLSARPRELDFVGRYGGEEFVMLLVDTNLDNAEKLANEIRGSVAESGFHSSTNEKILITISCGISEFREGDSADDVFARADAALYKAKREGKNCVVVA